MKDYKEKYEQLTKFIKDLYPFMSDYCKEKTEGMIPELKENEDERVKNEIIAFVERSIRWGGGTPIPREQENKWIAWLEKQGEQKPIDNVEPKFNVGDWITNNKLLVGQVTSFDGEYYHYMRKGIEHLLHISNTYNWHLWTIEDAKDGDVLTDGDLPFIFKKIDAYNYTYAYCGISLSGNFRIDSDGELGEWTWMLDIKPATKEQRDLLFQKMKEAGYEWDAEKKELKKIEQKPTWSEEDEKERKRVVGLLEGWLSTFKETCYAEDCKCGIAWLKTLKQRMKGETDEENNV